LAGSHECVYSSSRAAAGGTRLWTPRIAGLGCGRVDPCFGTLWRCGAAAAGKGAARNRTVVSCRWGGIDGDARRGSQRSSPSSGQGAHVHCPGPLIPSQGCAYMAYGENVWSAAQARLYRQTHVNYPGGPLAVTPQLTASAWGHTAYPASDAGARPAQRADRLVTATRVHLSDPAQISRSETGAVSRRPTIADARARRAGNDMTNGQIAHNGQGP